MDLGFRDHVTFYGSLGVLLMVCKETERIKNLRQRDVRKVAGDFFWGYAQSPQFNNRSNGCPCPTDNGFAIENGIFTDNIEMGGCGHDRTLGK